MSFDEYYIRERYSNFRRRAIDEIPYMISKKGEEERITAVANSLPAIDATIDEIEEACSSFQNGSREIIFKFLGGEATMLWDIIQKRKENQKSYY